MPSGGDIGGDMADTAAYTEQSNEEKPTLIMRQSRVGQKSGSGVEKVAPGGIENTGFFRGYREGARCLYLFLRKWG